MGSFADSLLATTLIGRHVHSSMSSGTTAKGATSATADKPDHPRLRLPKKDAANSGAFSKRETKKAARSQRPQAPRRSKPPTWRPPELALLYL